MRAKSGTDSKLCGNHIQTFWQDVVTFSPPSGSGACIEAQGDLKCGLFPPLLMEKEFFLLSCENCIDHLNSRDLSSFTVS